MNWEQISNEFFLETVIQHIGRYVPEPGSGAILRDLHFCTLVRILGIDLVWES